MARLPIEVIDIRDNRTADLPVSIQTANRIQNEIVFENVEPNLENAFRLLNFRTFNDRGFEKITELKRTSKGYHPFIIIFIDSPLQSGNWSNLFSTTAGGEGLAVVTTHRVEKDIIPKGLMLAYYLYYLALNTLYFIVPGHDNHSDTQSCVFDFKGNKKDIMLSMKYNAFCDSCRDALLKKGTHLSPEQFEALNQIFNQSGVALNTPQTIGNSHKPTIFIGSSVEGLKVARAIQAELSHEYSIEVWYQDTVFGLGTSTIEALETAVDKYDFGIFVFTPDDELITRGDIKQVARDNVIFESGLFIGKLTRFKAFIVHPDNNTIVLPSDLKGMTTAPYDASSKNLAASIAPACQKIRKAVSCASI